MGDYIKDISRKYPMFQGVIDQYSGHAIYQILHSKGIENIDLRSYNESSKSRIFKLIKDLYQEGLLDLMDHPVLIQEMLNMEAELRPQNKISVHKRKAADESFQDDITDAYVRAVWECWRYHNVDTGKSKDAPVLISFGTGRVFNLTNPINDMAARLKNANSLKEHHRVHKSLHGVDTKRTPQKRKFK